VEPLDESPVLVLVSADPEATHRANEAVRIALGILAGENQVTLVLVGPAVKILNPEVDDLIDGEDLARHLGTLRKLGQPFHVEGDGTPRSAGWNPHGLEIRPIDVPALARLVAGSRRILVF
jgi:hypothetical protein